MYGIALAAGAADPLQSFAASHRRLESQLAALELLPHHMARHGLEAVIHELEADHRTMSRQWAHFREGLNAIARGERVPLEAADVAAFAWLHRRHLEKESAIVLPFAREALGGAECCELADRMAARRREKV